MSTMGSQGMSERIKGAITALITPMTQNGVDYDSYQKLIEFQITSGIDGLVPTGTTGESPTLSHHEHDEVVKQCVQTVAGRVPVIAGTGSNNTSEAIELSQSAQKAGADALLLVVPYYNKPSQRGVLEHYTQIHNNTDLPIIVYDIPGRSIIGVDDETMGKLSQLERIIGVKDARGVVQRVDALSRLCAPGFIQLSGDDPSYLGYAAHGGDGAISVTSNVAPNDMHNIFAAVNNGDIPKARSINRRLSKLHLGLFTEPSPAVPKYICWRTGLISDPYVRSPIMPLSDETKKLADQMVKEAMPK